MYKKIGEAYGWSKRLLMKKEELLSNLSNNTFSIFLFYVDGVNAGYFEIGQTIGNVDLINLTMYT